MSKCLPILDQMPPEILEKIFGYTDTLDKLRLRQCCKYFKQVVNNSEIVLKKLMFYRKKYSKNRANVTVKITDRHHINKTFNDETPENAMEALKFVEKVLKSHPKIRVGHLSLSALFKTHELEEHSEHRTIVKEEVSRIFSGLRCKLPVKTLIMESMQDEQVLMSVLPHLVPGTLRRLFLANSNIETIDLPRTVETEQWKQAKVLDVDYLSIDVEETDHFEYMEYKVDRLEMDDVKRIVENILRDNGWKGRSIYSKKYDFDVIKQYLLQFDHIKEETNIQSIMMNDDDVFKMTIRRDGYECKIELNFFRDHLTFERIEDSVS